nr:hypothetical protein Itr_chr13CG09380 [Ipomoea trifida]
MIALVWGDSQNESQKRKIEGQKRGYSHFEGQFGIGMYTQADHLVEAIFVGLPVARLCKGYKLEGKLAGEQYVGVMQSLSVDDIVRFRVPLTVPLVEEDEAPPLYISLGATSVCYSPELGGLHAFQYQLYLELIQQMQDFIRQEWLLYYFILL